MIPFGTKVERGTDPRWGESMFPLRVPDGKWGNKSFFGAQNFQHDFLFVPFIWPCHQYRCTEIKTCAVSEWRDPIGFSGCMENCFRNVSLSFPNVERMFSHSFQAHISYMWKNGKPAWKKVRTRKLWDFPTKISLKVTRIFSRSWCNSAVFLCGAKDLNAYKEHKFT